MNKNIFFVLTGIFLFFSLSVASAVRPASCAQNTPCVAGTKCCWANAVPGGGIKYFMASCIGPDGAGVWGPQYPCVAGRVCSGIGPNNRCIVPPKSNCYEQQILQRLIGWGSPNGEVVFGGAYRLNELDSFLNPISRECLLSDQDPSF